MIKDPISSSPPRPELALDANARRKRTTHDANARRKRTTQTESVKSYAFSLSRVKSNAFPVCIIYSI